MSVTSIVKAKKFISKTEEKLHYLEEMVKWQERRTANGSLSVGLVLEGLTIYRKLYSLAETYEMRLLASAMVKDLESRM